MTLAVQRLVLAASWPAASFTVTVKDVVTGESESP